MRVCETIFNRRQAFEMPTSSDAYTVLTDNDLDTLVMEIVRISDRIGEKIVMGGLRRRGIRVQYRRLRQSRALERESCANLAHFKFSRDFMDAMLCPFTESSKFCLF